MRQEQHRKRETELKQKEDELILKELEEKKFREAKIAEEMRIKAEDQRIKEWEKQFDENQKKKEGRVVKKI